MTPRFIPLDNARAGMRLGIDICDARGAVLLAAGGELTEPLIVALRRRGIEQVCVATGEPLDAEALAARREATRLRIAHLFRRAGKADADRRLYEAVLDYRLEQLE
jgi:hypothetical protein